MEERGNGSRSYYQNRKRDIRISKYISEVQKHRLLEGKRYGTIPDDRPRERPLAMARFIKKHRNTKQIVSGEGEGPNFCPKSDVITAILFGRPIIQSFPSMLTEYYRLKYDVDLKDVKVLKCSDGQIAQGDGGRLAKWLHVNFTAKHKDDHHGYSEKVYFAEVIVFVFRFAPLFCNVITCLPVDDDGSGTCKCLLPNCSGIGHPSKNAYVDALLLASSPITPLWETAKFLFDDLICSGTRITGGVWFTAESLQASPNPTDKQQRNCIVYGYRPRPRPRPVWIDLRRGGSSVVEAEEKYLYRSLNAFPEMSKDIPVPKKKLLSEVKKQSNGLAEVQKRALVIAKHIENCKKPRKPAPIACQLIEALLRKLPDFYREKDGADLEELNDFRISEKKYPEKGYKRDATWLHMNFSAKCKNDDSGVSENLYFAEVVEICYLLQVPIYIVIVCVPVDKNDPSGKCGICSRPRLQICHPSQGSYIDDTSKMDPSKFPEWK